MRVGVGYDVHRLTTGRKLVLGGVTIPFKKGLLGHSDADVLVHAVCDALLGAAGLDDIGAHFPDTDPQYRDVCSLTLLSQVGHKLSQIGCQIQNVDATIFAEAPRICAYRDAMRCNLSRTLAVATRQVNIKATTMEGLGAIGRGDGIAALSVALVTIVGG